MVALRCPFLGPQNGACFGAVRAFLDSTPAFSLQSMTGGMGRKIDSSRIKRRYCEMSGRRFFSKAGAKNVKMGNKNEPLSGPKSGAQTSDNQLKDIRATHHGPYFELHFLDFKMVPVLFPILLFFAPAFEKSIGRTSRKACF